MRINRAAPTTGWALASVLLLAACGEPTPGIGGESVRAAIHEVQGPGSDSPYRGRPVVVTGLVSGDFQDADGDESANLGGFYLQSAQADDDPATSEGLFVFDRNLNGPDVRAGDRVRVAGTVVEQFGETQIEATSVEVLGSGVLRPAELTLPVSSAARNGDGEIIADLERFEGMLVTVRPTLHIQDLHTLERYGDLLLSTATRDWTFTSIHEPDVAGFVAWQAEMAMRRLVLDDGLVRRDHTPIRYLHPEGSSPGFLPRVGDAVEGLQGVLRYSRGSGADGMETWRLMPVTEPRFTRRNAREARPELAADVVVASFNVLNFFATIDRGNAVCGPDASDRCRGADSVREFERQRSKIVTAIRALEADIVGLMEIENDAAVGVLVEALNAAAGAASWSAVDTGVIGDDAIRVALVYRRDRVAAVGAHAVLDTGVDARFDAGRNRPALAQTFRSLVNGGVLTVSVNHLKSKGSPCDDSGDPDTGDGQGNCNTTRRNAAIALAYWLATDPTDSDDPDFLVIGDLNAYRKEDPVRALTAAGLVNLVEQHVGPDAWSFVFRGESGLLDHAFASASLAPQVSGVAIWHTNADEAPVLDYNLESGRDPALFDAALPWRASDHDPVLIGLQLDAE